MAINDIHPDRYKQAIILSTIKYLVYVAGISVWFRSKGRPRNEIFSFCPAKNGTTASPIFCAVFDSPSSFFAAPKLHGNACHSSEQQVTEEIGLDSVSCKNQSLLSFIHKIIDLAVSQKKKQYNQTSLIRTPKRQNQVSALQRCPY